MGRVDSGIDDSFNVKASHEERKSLRRNNTSPVRKQQPQQMNPEPLSPSTTGKPSRRSGSKHESIDQRKSKDRRRKSIASSSENSTKSRTRGNGSKPSSRRTSCTVVDPSRPTRHYRIKSTQSIATASGEIDDVLALHFRSCSIFQNPCHQASGRSEYNQHSSGHDEFDTGNEINSKHTTPHLLQASPEAKQAATTASYPKNGEDVIAAAERSPTIDWMSTTTRKREYERIDRANSGVRGLIRKVLPRCVSGPPPPRFYEKDMSDVGSVRRYRLSLDEDDQEGSPSLLKEKTQTTAKHRSQNNQKTMKWGCF